MATVESLIGEALDALGHVAPTGLSGTWTDKHALMALRAWPTVLKDLTARHPWSFAITRVLLATPHGTPPAYGFAKQYALPAGCVRILSVGNDLTRPDYQLEGGFIQMDADQVPLRYVRLMEDPAVWPAWFAELMVHALIARIAYRVTNSSSEADRRQTEYLHKLHFATAVDNTENQSDVLGDEYPLIEARLF